MAGKGKKKSPTAINYEAFDRQRSAELGGTFVVQTPSDFTDEQINQLIALVDEDSDPGTLSTGAASNHPLADWKHEQRMAKVRRSEIHWLDEVTFKWVYDAAWRLAKQANLKYKFQIKPIRERIQLSVYNGSDKGFYTWHTDTSINNMSRKISLSIPLSDPSDYTGGELQFMIGGEGVSVPQPKGGAVIFPSIEMHRVTPVTSGRRYSLVIWVSGPHWS